MDAKQINASFDLLTLVGDLHKAGGYHVGPCPFCGGTDRFTVKHMEDGDRWHCRQCGDGKYHTPIDYIMRRDGVDFKEALKTLGGDATASNFIPRKAEPTPPRPLAVPASGWQADTWREVDTASKLLGPIQPEGQAARMFLASRGFHRGTQKAWHLGFTYAFDHVVKRKRPAITIPWLDMDSTCESLTAIKYRFIDDDPNPRAMRYSCKGGSKFDAPYGLWDALPGIHQTLMLVEGEFNCLSVWQCLPKGVTCLSFGSEGSGYLRVLQAMANHYQHVFVWADDLWSNPKQIEHAQNLHALVKGNGKRLQSVMQDDIKYDANELLQQGVLADFLSRILDVPCLGWGMGNVSDIQVRP